MIPVVSVCIPTYNTEQYISAAIESVLVQTFEEFELLIIDDCSSDATVEIARRYRDPRVRVRVNDANLGAAGNWNLAIGLARGTFVKVLCCDDLLYPTILERQVAALCHAGSVGVMAAAKRDIIDVNGAILVRGRGLSGMSGVVPGGQAISRAVRSGTNPFGEPGSVLVRAESLRQVGPFRAEAEYMLDLDMWCRLLAVGSLVAIPESLAAFRVRETSWSHALARRQSAQACRLLKNLRREHPMLVSRASLAQGSVRALGLAWCRRAVYRLLALCNKSRLGSGAAEKLVRAVRLSRALQRSGRMSTHETRG